MVASVVLRSRNLPLVQVPRVVRKHAPAVVNSDELVAPGELAGIAPSLR